MNKKIVFSILGVSLISIGVFATLNYNKSFQGKEKTQQSDYSSTKYIDNTVNIPDSKIYANINFVDADEKIAVGDTEAVYDFSNLVVIGTIIEKDKGTASEISAFPYTPAKLKIDKVIKGNLDDDTINIIVPGGTCTVADFIKASEKNFPERIIKMGLDKLSDKEKQEEYIQYNYKYSKNFEAGKQYVIMLNKNKDNSYSAMSNAGFLDLNVSNSSLKSTNSNQITANDINTKEDILNLPNSIKLD